MKTRCLLAIGALAASPAFAQDKTLTISVYGVAQDAYRDALYAPFEAQCGCTLVVEAGNSSERLAKLEANAARPVVDVIAFSDANALEAVNKDLIAPLSGLTNLPDIYEFARDPVGGNMAVGYTFYGTSIVYRSDEVTVDSWLDLFSEDLAGYVALPNIATTQGPVTLMMLQRALGKDDPEFTDAIDLVAAHKDDVVTFYERGSQIPQLLQQEEILAAVVGRFGWANIAKLGLPVAWAQPKEGQTGGMNVLSMVKGTQQPELAQDFIDYWLSSDVQQKLAEGLVDSPVNMKVTVDDAVAESLTYGEDMASQITFLPAAVQLDHRESWLTRWNEKVAQ